jgi:MFS family permease
MLVALVGVLSGALLLLVTLNIPIENQGMFMVFLMLTALFIPFAAPNVVSTVYDITLPEVRSTAMSVQYFIESSGAALAPLLAGFIARAFNLETAILTICVTTWLIGAVIIWFNTRLVPADIQTLRQQLSQRAEEERKLQVQIQ